jgi:hypothetical protein
MVLLRHESDVDTWGGPDRDYYTFVVVSVLLGLVGGDHIYLRSFKTAFLKALVNLFTFGAWYWWDLSQIFFQKETILQEGLASPFDWIRNIGRGVFTNPLNPIEYSSQKSYIVYGVLTVFFGLIAADKFYMGDYVMGIAKLVLCFNIFTFLIGWLWAGWDAWNAVFCEKELLEKGIPPPLGLGMVFPSTDASVFKLREKKEGDAAALEGLGLSWLPSSGPVGQWVHWFLCVFGLTQNPEPKCSPRTFFPPTTAAATTATATTAAATTATTAATAATANKAPATTTTATDATATTANKAAATIKAAAAAATAATANKAPEPSVAESAKTQEAPEVKDAAATVSQRQTGGAYAEDVAQGGGPGPVVAGALTAVLAMAGLKQTYDFLSNQYQ